MSKRSQWCEFDKETRKHIKKRDENKCVICHNTGALQIAHIFLSRAKGGKGDKRNGVCLCVKCHKILDNPGSKEIKHQEQIKNILILYLKEKEKIINIEETIKELKFNKYDNLSIKYTLNSKNIAENSKKIQKRCKNCVFLSKNNISNSSLPNYFCKYKHININKTTKACKSYKEK